MIGATSERYDFFLSRRGSVAAIAQEVADVLTEKGYKVLVEDYDIPLGASFVEAMHEGDQELARPHRPFTRDYESRPTPARSSRASRRNVRRARRSGTSSSCAARTCRCEGCSPTTSIRTSWASRTPKSASGASSPPPSVNRRQRHPPPRPFIGVPPRIASFTGRADELDRLDAILMQDKPAAVTQASVGRAAVQGMGGVGKTSLAIEYAHRFRGLYAGVCWCPAETRTGLLSALATLAVTLGAATAEEADVEKAAKAALRRLAEQRATWLLVYDNVTAPDEIADLLPSAGARVLITSRFSDWSEVAEEVALDVLPLEEAVALLQSRTGRRDAAGARTLAEALGRLPLALDHAAAYCKRTQMRFADYAEKASSLIAAAPRGAGYPRSVAATFDLAITEAVAQCQAAEALMAYLAQCAPERIPMTLVEGAVEDEAERLQALAALAEVSLVKHDPFEDGTPAVTVHRLVQAVARARSEANGSAQGAIGRLIARLVAIYPEGRSTTIRSHGRCARSLRRICLRGAKRALMTLRRLQTGPSFWTGQAVISSGARLTPRPRRFFAMRWRSARRRSAPSIPIRRPSLNNLALPAQGPGRPCGGAAALRARAGDPRKGARPRASRYGDEPQQPRQPAPGPGRPCGARPLFERALAIREKVLGPEHPDTATSLNNLALLLKARATLRGRGRSTSARWRSTRRRSAPSIPIRRRASTTSPACSRTRATLRGRGRSTSARWRSARRRSAPSIPHTATSLNNLALLLQDQGDFAGARPLYERALAIREKALGPEHPDYGDEPQQPRRPAPGQGDLAGRGRSTSARWRSTRRRSAPSIPIRRRASTTSPSCSRPRATLRARGRSSSARWRYARRRSAPSIPIRRRASTTSPSCSRPGRPCGARPLFERALAIPRRRSAPSIQAPIARAAIWLACSS